MPKVLHLALYWHGSICVYVSIIHTHVLLQGSDGPPGAIGYPGIEGNTGGPGERGDVGAAGPAGPRVS